MAPRTVDQNTANQVLQDTLGISADDLGMDREDSLADLDLGDDGGVGDEGNEPDLDGDNLPGSVREPQEPEPAPRIQEPPKPDDLSVTHTPKDEFDHGKPKFDKKGNILGSRGQVIATAGREARMYQSLHTERARNADLVQRANTAIQAERGKLQQAIDIGISVANQLKAVKDVGQLHTKAGLDDNDLRMAIEFASAYKKNSVEGLKMILTRAAASGIDLTQLGLQPGGFDPTQLLNMVREEIGKVAQPIQARTQEENTRQQQTREQEQAVENAKTELNQFLTANPEAREYLPVITEVYKNPQFASMSLGEVWSRIQLNRLQMERAGTLPPRGQQQSRSPNRQQQPRLPNGRGTPPNSGGGRVDVNELAPVTDSYEDILRGVLRAVGE